MRHFSETIEIARLPQDVWRAIGTPERWFAGYVETRSRSADYPGPDTRIDHLRWTRRKEEVDARATRSESPRVLEEDLEGTTFFRHVRYSLKPCNGGTALRVNDDVRFKGLGKLAAAIATRDIKLRWHSSLEKLKATAEGGHREHPTARKPDQATLTKPNRDDHGATPGTAPRHQRPACSHPDPPDP